MADYRCISMDLMTGTRIAEIPLTGLTYSKILNGAGDATGTLFLPPPTTTTNRALASDWNNAVDECRRQLVIERDNVVVWSGIVWASPYNDDDQTRYIRCAEDWSYFHKRFVDYDLYYAATAQMTIAKNLVDTAQAYAPANLGITTVLNVAAGYSDTIRERTYARSEVLSVGEAVEQLASPSNGFDFGIDSAWNPTTGALVKTLNLHYPRRGRSYLETGHVFEVGRNVISFTWPSDGTRTSNKAWAIGSGEGASKVIGTAVDTAKFQPLSSGGPGYPLLESRASHNDVSVQETIDRLAQGALQYASSPVTLPELTVRADADPVLGAYIVGDACRVIINPDTSPRFPDGLDTYYRIVGYTVTVDDNGQEDVKLTLGSDFVYA